MAYKLYKTSDYWSRDMHNLNFIFSEKSLGLVSSPHSVCDFSRKMFLMLYSINWPNFIVWLPLLLEILGNMYYNCLLTRLWRHKIWQPDLSNQTVLLHEKNDENSRQIFKYLENEKSFWGEIKLFFIIFKGLSVAKNCLRPGNAPLKHGDLDTQVM